MRKLQIIYKIVTFLAPIRELRSRATTPGKHTAESSKSLSGETGCTHCLATDRALEKEMGEKKTGTILIHFKG